MRKVKERKGKRCLKNKENCVFNDNIDNLLFPNTVVKKVGQSTSKIRIQVPVVVIKKLKKMFIKKKKSGLLGYLLKNYFFVSFFAKDDL